MREQCASCKTVESTKYRIESNWHLCDDCHISWVRCEEEFNNKEGKWFNYIKGVIQWKTDTRLKENYLDIQIIVHMQ